MHDINSNCSLCVAAPDGVYSVESAAQSFICTNRSVFLSVQVCPQSALAAVLTLIVLWHNCSEAGATILNLCNDVNSGAVM
jgi:hypothetical protein